MKGALVLLALAACASANRVIMESDVTTFSAPNWVRKERVSESDELSVRFMMRHDQEKRNEFETIFYDIANPRSVNYGKFLTNDQIKTLLPISMFGVERVLRFLSIYGVKDVQISTNNGIISAVMKATVAERLFETTLFHYGHVRDSTLDLIRCGSPYSLPVDVAEHVQLVTELIRLPRIRGEHVTKAVPSNIEATSSWNECGTKYATYVNPWVLQERYGYPTLTKIASGNSMAVAEFQKEYYDQGDLEAFASTCGLTTASGITDVGTEDGDYCDSGLERCVEALLDIEYITQVAYGVPLTVYYESTYDLEAFFLKLENTADDDLEYVLSVSYGNDEAQQTSDDYMYTVNTELMKVGARGMTIFIAAGDQGAWGREGTDGDVFHPDFPASSPYVTAVGGTDFLVKGTIGTEKTWEDGGGGFSNTFPIPSYQADDVATYLDSDGVPPSRFYNSSGRGYPDVSALAGTQNAYLVSYKDGSIGGVGGTSAASPVVAGVFAVLNNARLEAGLSQFGFVNTWIYECASGSFNDVVTGTNDEGNTYGFTAEKGWDAATGFGTPNYADLVKVAISCSA